MNKTVDNKRICPQCGAKMVYTCLACSDGGSAVPIADHIDRDDSPPGYIFVATNGLILDADSISAALLGTERIALFEKPLTLFISGEDLADFFIHRNALFATHEVQNFEIKLRKKDRSIFNAKLTCTFIRNWKKNTDCMRVSFRDYTRRRHELDQLGRKTDIENIIHSITTHLIRCPSREIDATLNGELKRLAMFSEVERTYLCVIDESATRLSLTHEWCVPGITPIRKEFRTTLLDRLPGLTGAITRGKRLQIEDIGTGSGDWYADLDRFHIDGTQSFAYFVLEDNRSVRGVIGYDACHKQSNWGRDDFRLYQFAGHAFLNAVFRKQNETAWLNRHHQASNKPVISSGPLADGKTTLPSEATPSNWNMPIEIEEITETGEIHEIFKIMDTRQEEKETSKWQYIKADSDSPSPEIMKIPIIDGKLVITCPQCMQQDQISPERFSSIGKTVMATCPCQFQFDLTPEMRSYYRKDVDLEGVFLQTKSKNLMSDSSGYSGKIRITNLSKKGLGFLTEGNSHLRIGDQIRTKFTLDNHAHSLITKQVLIRGVKEQYVGGQFLGSDKNDITLGFYLM